MACLKAGLATFYGPSVMSGFAENGGMHNYLTNSIRHALFDTNPIGPVAENNSGWTVELLDWQVAANNAIPRALNPPYGWRYLQGHGVVRGHLLGGCLEVLDGLRGTPLWPSKETWQGAMLFLETSEEATPPDIVARMLRSIAATGALNELSGILMGRPGGQVDQTKFDLYDAALVKIVTQECGLSHLPIITQMDFGHTDPMMTLPYGALAQIDCEQREFSLLTAGVV